MLLACLQFRAEPAAAEPACLAAFTQGTQLKAIELVFSLKHIIACRITSLTVDLITIHNTFDIREGLMTAVNL